MHDSLFHPSLTKPTTHNKASLISHCVSTKVVKASGKMCQLNVAFRFVLGHEETYGT